LLIDHLSEGGNEPLSLSQMLASPFGPILRFHSGAHTCPDAHGCVRLVQMAMSCRFHHSFLPVAENTSSTTADLAGGEQQSDRARRVQKAIEDLKSLML
jgi:hypothetical protein